MQRSFCRFDSDLMKNKGVPLTTDKVVKTEGYHQRNALADFVAAVGTQVHLIVVQAERIRT